jgi:hypothetical protein
MNIGLKCAVVVLLTFDASGWCMSVQGGVAGVFGSRKVPPLSTWVVDGGWWVRSMKNFGSQADQEKPVTQFLLTPNLEGGLEA